MLVSLAFCTEAVERGGMIGRKQEEGLLEGAGAENIL